MLYLALLAIVWVGAILMTLLGGFLPYAMIHDALVAAHTAPGRRPRNREWVAVSLYFFAVLFAGTFLPVWISLVLCLVIVVGYLLLCRLPVRASVQFLWRRSGTVHVRSLTWSDWVTWEFAVVALALGALILTTCGDRLGGGVVGENMPITGLMGIFLAWLAPRARRALRANDARASARSGSASAADRTDGQRLRSRDAHGDPPQICQRGWRVRFSNRPATPLEVPLRFSATPILGGAGDAQWPLPVSHSEFVDPAFWFVIGRRNEIQLRRKLLTALERLFKVAGQRPARPGSGYWVAPHFWFVPGLMRDSNRDADDEVDFADHALLSGTVGPPYHRLIPRSVRHHFWIMMRALQVDLLFVEDGVGFRRTAAGVARALRSVRHACRSPAGQRDRFPRASGRPRADPRVPVRRAVQIGDVPGAEIRLSRPGADPARLPRSRWTRRIHRAAVRHEPLTSPDGVGIIRFAAERLARKRRRGWRLLRGTTAETHPPELPS